MQGQNPEKVAKHCAARHDRHFVDTKKPALLAEGLNGVNH